MSTKRENTRKSLLEAAWKRLERGDATKLEDVGHDVGVSRQAVYLHFGSRGGMLLALVAHIDEALGLNERIRAMLAVTDPVEQLHSALKLTADYEPKIHAVAMALSRQAHEDEDLRTAFDDRMKRRRQGLVQIVKRVGSAGLLRKPWTATEVADALWQASTPASYETLVVECGWKPARYGEWLAWLAQSFLVR